MSFTVYTIEMAYAQMRSLQEQANRSRARQVLAARRRERAPHASRRAVPAGVSDESGRR
ncbi:hypothetical protein ACFYYH_12835 [Streptomyces sp. NPDC002018]|uniref:hypothetical protein n=1 Tax=Streptomyces sp. NPDC002018 TaxID=3364629 RepID=UPI00369DD5EC